MTRSRPRRARRLIWGAAIVAVAATPYLIRALLWRLELNPVLRGRLVAAEAGCFACHQPHAGVEIPNPGSRWGTVPRFGAGKAFMYAPEREGIEEFIRFGAPRAWLEDERTSSRLQSQHLRMPAFEARLGEGEIDSLVTYVCTVEGLALADGEAAAQGRDLARQHGCLSCHGVEGSGGLPNPGSVGGFIPGFAGRNFQHMVRDEAEFREWVLEGTSSRLAANPALRFFWRRQTIAMPAYREELGETEVKALWTWVQAVRGGGGC